MSFLISDALAGAPAAAGPAGGLEGLIFPIGLIIILYFVMIRPQMRRQKEHRQLVESLKKGDEVQTEGGVLGRIVAIGDSFVNLEIADGVVIKLRRSAVATVLPKGTLKEL